MPGLSLPRGSRLTRHRDVRQPMDHGRSAASGAVVVYAWGREDDRPPRYGLLVGRRWGDAPRRNRVRRLLRESFRTARPHLPPGYDFVLLPRRPLHSLRMQTVREDLVRAALAAASRFRREGPGARATPGAEAKAT